MTLLLMALAGGVGSSIRLLLAERPWGLYLVNGTGSLALGLLVGLAPSEELVLVLGVGLLGGYTTFSAASLATARLSLQRDTAGILLSSVGMLALCVAGAALGAAVA